MNNESTYKGVQGFRTKEAGRLIQRLTRNLPIILFSTGFILRIIFLSVIIPTLAYAFRNAPMNDFSYICIIWCLPVLLEFTFSLSQLTNPSMFVSMRKWAYAFFFFGIIGAIYNGTELYLFVQDVAQTTEEDSWKIHLLLQLSNLASWSMSEGAGLMILNNGLFNPVIHVTEETEKKQVQELQEAPKSYYSLTRTMLKTKKGMQEGIIFQESANSEEIKKTFQQIAQHIAVCKNRIKNNEGSADTNLKNIEFYTAMIQKASDLPMNETVYPEGTL